MRGSTDMTAPHGTATSYQEAQRAEWSKYVAAVPIDFYGTRAYNVGDPVPVSAVDGDDAWIDQQWVTAQGDQQPTSATTPPPEPPTIDPATVAAPPAAAAAPPPGSSTDGSNVTSSEG
jgi:hypothetical protein